MRLVFLLYAEDRDLLPSSTDPALKQLWENGYSIKTLYARLLVDEALNPDTMDERRGGWGQLLAVFRLIHDGHPGWVTGRGGKLFDPDAFPFLEGRDKGSARADAMVLPVSDGTILRILHGLMTIEGRSLSGEKIRERLSYRSLDVESIGSVYETVMGFTAARAKERMIALRDEKKLPNFIGLDTLLAQKAERPAEMAEGPLDQALREAGQGREGGGRRPRAYRSFRLAGRRARLAQGDADRARRALSAADRGAPPLRLALHAALVDRADRAPRAGAGFRAPWRQGLARGGAGAESARSRLRLRRLSRRSLPPTRRAAGAGLEYVWRGEARAFRRTRTRRCMRAGWSRKNASMASTAIRWRSISRGFRSGSRRWRATTNSPSSITR